MDRTGSWESAMSFAEVAKQTRADDRDKVDYYAKMGGVSFLTRDIKDYEADDEGQKLRTKLHAQISFIPRDSKDRVKLDFCLLSFKQFMSQLGIPHQYVLKCPADLAKENVNYWKSIFADKDLLIRARWGQANYARAILPASYGKMDNTPLVNLVGEISEELGLRVWRYDIPDHAFFAKCLLPDFINMGTSRNPDNVHLGFQLGGSECGTKITHLDILTYRVVCTNGAIALVNGERLVKMAHKGDFDSQKFKDEIRAKIHDTVMHKDRFFGPMVESKDVSVPDVIQEVRMLWDMYKLGKQNRELVYEMLTQKYQGGTKWDIVQATTEVARALADNADERVKIEEAAGSYLQVKGLLTEGAR